MPITVVQVYALLFVNYLVAAIVNQSTRYILGLLTGLVALVVVGADAQVCASFLAGYPVLWLMPFLIEGVLDLFRD